MRYQHVVIWAGTVLFAIAIIGCGSGPAMNKEASTSAIRAAEEAGAADVPTASLYLQLAKEQLEKAQVLAANGDRDQAESMLLRAQADGELAIALSRGDADRKEALKAIERVQELRKNNQLPMERK